jgi:hypothetical protein
VTDHSRPITTRCHKCKRPTQWVPGRGGRFSRCSECGDRFPCAHECAHVDCKAERADAKREVQP